MESLLRSFGRKGEGKGKKINTEIKKPQSQLTKIKTDREKKYDLPITCMKGGTHYRHRAVKIIKEFCKSLYA